MTISDIKKIVQPLQRRIMLMIARGIIKSVKGQQAQVELLEGEIRDGVDFVQQFGFASRPKPGAEAVVVFVGGNRDHGVVLGTNDPRGRPSLEPGEAAMWTADVVVKIKADKTVEITGASKMKIPCDLEVAGKVTATGIVKGSEVQNAAGTKLGTHVHTSGGSGSPTSPPTPGS